MKLNLGSGYHLKEGFVNLDLVLGHRLPEALGQYGTGTIDLIFSEHFIEHLTWEQGLALVKECHRVLKPGGVVRFSCPDLRIVAERYLAGQIDCYGGAWLPTTPCQMMNEGMRAWNHVYMYDEPELKRLFTKSGFTNVRGCDQFAECLRYNFGDIYVEATK